MTGNPDLNTFGYTFARAELSLNRKIYTAIKSVRFEQPSQVGVIRGTRPWPLKNAPRGRMEQGDGAIVFSDDGERAKFLGELGNGWRDVEWSLSWILSAKGAPNINYAAFGCRVTDNPIDHEQGDEALGGEIAFVALYHTINGKVPHTGLPAPSQ